MGPSGLTCESGRSVSGESPASRFGFILCKKEAGRVSRGKAARDESGNAVKNGTAARYGAAVIEFT